LLDSLLQELQRHVPHVTMSQFELRDALANSDTSAEHKRRVADVFSSLGSGQVKSDKDDDERMRNFKPDFDRQQLERSGGSFEKKERRHEDERDNKDREFKRPKFDDRNRDRGGRRGGGRGRGGRVPDHVKNPEKYTKYSLKDVPELSDRSNSAAAFDFLRKLKEKDSEESEPPADLSQKIVFKKREKKAANNVKEDLKTDESSTNESSSSTKTKTKSKNKNKSKQMMLSHLDEEEEEEC